MAGHCYQATSSSFFLSDEQISLDVEEQLDRSQPLFYFVAHRQVSAVASTELVFLVALASLLKDILDSL